MPFVVTRVERNDGETVLWVERPGSVPKDTQYGEIERRLLPIVEEGGCAVVRFPRSSQAQLAVLSLRAWLLRNNCESVVERKGSDVVCVLNARGA